MLVPTVALAGQWYKVVHDQLRNVQIRFLSGADGVERWRDQWIWDEVLKDVRVIICTYQVGSRFGQLAFLTSILTMQILLDALVHSFISMSKLALVVFDEGVASTFTPSRMVAFT